MIKFLKQLRASFFQWLSTGLFILLITSCGSYTISSYHPNIKSLLAITEKGDTVSVSIREFERQKYGTYTRFNYNNNWYWNDWRYNSPYFWSYPYRWNNNLYWNNNYIYTPRVSPRPKVQPRTRPRYTSPRNRPKLREQNERIRINTPRRNQNSSQQNNTVRSSSRRGNTNSRGRRN